MTDYAEPRRRRRSRRSAEEEGNLLGRLGGGLVLGLFLALLVVSPLPMGGNRDWAWAPQVLAVAVMAILCALGLGAPRADHGLAEDERRPMFALIGCFAAMVLIGIVQVIPLLPDTASAPVYARAREILSTTRSTIPSLSADLTLYTLLKCLGCALFFLVARRLCRDEATARLLLIALMVSAVAVLAYALYVQTGWHGCYLGSYLKKSYPYVPASDRCLMSGTFVGSNNFACFVGMALVAAVAMLFGDQQRGDSDGEEEGEEYTSPLAAWLSGTRLALLAIALICLGGILFSGSRAGFAAVVACVIAVPFLMMRGLPRRRGSLRRMILVGGVVFVVVGLIAGGALIRKYETLKDIQSYDRILIWKVSLELVAKAPLIGWGLGNYGAAHTLNQPDQSQYYNDKAHSTPLEAVDELGIPGGLISWFVVLIPCWVCLRGASTRHRTRYLMVAAFAASGVAIVHSMVDFSLQIPAIGFFVSALLGMGWAQAFPPSERHLIQAAESVEEEA